MHLIKPKNNPSVNQNVPLPKASRTSKAGSTAGIEGNRLTVVPKGGQQTVLLARRPELIPSGDPRVKPAELFNAAAQRMGELEDCPSSEQLLVKLRTATTHLSNAEAAGRPVDPKLAKKMGKKLETWIARPDFFASNHSDFAELRKVLENMKRPEMNGALNAWHAANKNREPVRDAALKSLSSSNARDGASIGSDARGKQAPTGQPVVELEAAARSQSADEATSRAQQASVLAAFGAVDTSDPKILSLAQKAAEAFKAYEDEQLRSGLPISREVETARQDLDNRLFKWIHGGALEEKGRVRLAEDLRSPLSQLHCSKSHKLATQVLINRTPQGMKFDANRPPRATPKKPEANPEAQPEAQSGAEPDGIPQAPQPSKQRHRDLADVGWSDFLFAKPEPRVAPGKPGVPELVADAARHWRSPKPLLDRYADPETSEKERDEIHNAARDHCRQVLSAKRPDGMRSVSVVVRYLAAHAKPDGEHPEDQQIRDELNQYLKDNVDIKESDFLSDRRTVTEHEMVSACHQLSNIEIQHFDETGAPQTRPSIRLNQSEAAGEALQLIANDAQSRLAPQVALVHDQNHWIGLIAVRGFNNELEWHSFNPQVDTYAGMSTSLKSLTEQIPGASPNSTSTGISTPNLDVVHACGVLDYLMFKAVNARSDQDPPLSVRGAIKNFIGAWNNLSPEARRAAVVAGRAEMLQAAALRGDPQMQQAVAASLEPAEPGQLGPDYMTKATAIVQVQLSTLLSIDDLESVREGYAIALGTARVTLDKRGIPSSESDRHGFVMRQLGTMMKGGEITDAQARAFLGRLSDADLRIILSAEDTPEYLQQFAGSELSRRVSQPEEEAFASPPAPVSGAAMPVVEIFNPAHIDLALRTAAPEDTGLKSEEMSDARATNQRIQVGHLVQALAGATFDTTLANASAQRLKDVLAPVPRALPPTAKEVESANTLLLTKFLREDFAKAELADLVVMQDNVNRRADPEALQGHLAPHKNYILLIQKELSESIRAKEVDKQRETNANGYLSHTQAAITALHGDRVAGGGETDLVAALNALKAARAHADKLIELDPQSDSPLSPAERRKDLMERVVAGMDPNAQLAFATVMNGPKMRQLIADMVAARTTLEKEGLPVPEGLSDAVADLELMRDVSGAAYKVKLGRMPPTGGNVPQARMSDVIREVFGDTEVFAVGLTANLQSIVDRPNFDGDWASVFKGDKPVGTYYLGVGEKNETVVNMQDWKAISASDRTRRMRDGLNNMHARTGASNIQQAKLLRVANVETIRLITDGVMESADSPLKFNGASGRVMGGTAQYTFRIMGEDDSGNVRVHCVRDISPTHFQAHDDSGLIPLSSESKAKFEMEITISPTGEVALGEEGWRLEDALLPVQENRNHWDELLSVGGTTPREKAALDGLVALRAEPSSKPSFNTKEKAEAFELANEVARHEADYDDEKKLRAILRANPALQVQYEPLLSMSSNLGGAMSSLVELGYVIEQHEESSLRSSFNSDGFLRRELEGLSTDQLVVLQNKLKNVETYADQLKSPMNNWSKVGAKALVELTKAVKETLDVRRQLDVVLNPSSPPEVVRRAVAVLNQRLLKTEHTANDVRGILMHLNASQLDRLETTLRANGRDADGVLLEAVRAVRSAPANSEARGVSPGEEAEHAAAARRIQQDTWINSLVRLLPSDRAKRQFVAATTPQRLTATERFLNWVFSSKATRKAALARAQRQPLEYKSKTRAQVKDQLAYIGPAEPSPGSNELRRRLRPTADLQQILARRGEFVASVANDPKLQSNPDDLAEAIRNMNMVMDDVAEILREREVAPRQAAAPVRPSEDRMLPRMQAQLKTQISTLERTRHEFGRPVSDETFALVLQASSSLVALRNFDARGQSAIADAEHLERLLEALAPDLNDDQVQQLTIHLVNSGIDLPGTIQRGLEAQVMKLSERYVATAKGAASAMAKVDEVGYTNALIKLRYLLVQGDQIRKIQERLGPGRPARAMVDPADLTASVINELSTENKNALVQALDSPVGRNLLAAIIEASHNLITEGDPSALFGELNGMAGELSLMRHALGQALNEGAPARTLQPAVNLNQSLDDPKVRKVLSDVWHIEVSNLDEERSLSVAPSTWRQTYPYAEPLSVAQILDANAPEDLRRDFTTQTERLYSAEGMHYLNALSAFKASGRPTIQGARELIDRFFEADGPESLNFGYDQIPPVLAAFNSVGSEEERLARVLPLFDGFVPLVVQELQNNGQLLSGFKSAVARGEFGLPPARPLGEELTPRARVGNESQPVAQPDVRRALGADFDAVASTAAQPATRPLRVSIPDDESITPPLPEMPELPELPDSSQLSPPMPVSPVPVMLSESRGAKKGSRFALPSFLSPRPRAASAGAAPRESGVGGAGGSSQRNLNLRPGSDASPAGARRSSDLDKANERRSSVAAMFKLLRDPVEDAVIQTVIRANLEEPFDKESIANLRSIDKDNLKQLEVALTNLSDQSGSNVFFRNAVKRELLSRAVGAEVRQTFGSSFQTPNYSKLMESIARLIEQHQLSEEDAQKLLVQALVRLTSTDKYDDKVRALLDRTPELSERVLELEDGGRLKQLAAQFASSPAIRIAQNWAESARIATRSELSNLREMKTQDGLMTSEKFAQGVIRAAEHAALADLEQELAVLVSASLAPREVNLDGVSDETLSKLVVTCTKIGAPVVVAKAEFQIKLRQMRKQEFEERARLEAVLQTQVNGLSPAESGAATITVNFEKHGSLPVAQRMFMNPNGIRVVVDGRAELLVEPGADTTGLGLRRLLDLIEWDSVNGDKAEQLKKLTHLLNPHLLEKFGEFMLDGQRGMPAGEDVHTSITVERDEAGAFRIHFDHRIGDVRTFTQPGGKEIQIAPGTQSAQLSFEVALGNDGGDPLVVENTIKCEIE